MFNEHCSSGEIVNADCVRVDEKFILCGVPNAVPDLFTVRLRAPADYHAGDVFVLRGKTLPVLTQEMRSAPDGVFRAGAVVHAGIDLACARAFVGTGGGAGGESGTETDPVYTADKPFLAPLASPAFTGIPKAPTAPTGTATTQLATTEFVATAIEEADVTPSAAFAMVPDYANQETVNRTPTKATTWVVDRDGFIQCRLYTGTDANINLIINNVICITDSYSLGAVIPVEAGDTIQYSGAHAAASIYTYYIPPKYVPVNRGYSTDEQLTGETWIDGRPIFKKTMQFTFGPVQTYTTLPTLNAGGAYIIRMEFDGNTTPINYPPWFGSGAGSVGYSYNNTTGILSFWTTSSQKTSTPGCCTAYYVKP